MRTIKATGRRKAVILSSAAIVGLALASGAIAITDKSMRDATAEAKVRASARADQAIRTAARDACRKAVLAQLKSPGSARWVGQTVTPDDKGGFEVVGDVDAQNGFGALMRLSYTCQAGGSKDGANAFVWQHD
jgi:hypothetical protein